MIPLRVTYENTTSKPSKLSVVDVNASRLQTIDELSVEIYSVIERNVNRPLDDFGLFLARKGVWLDPLKYVWEVQDINSSAFLELRPKKRFIKIRFLDGGTKTLEIDESQIVKEITKGICEQLRLDKETHEEVSLVVAGDYAVDASHPISPKLNSGSLSPSVIRRIRSTPSTNNPSSPLLHSKSPKPVHTGPSMSPSRRRRTTDNTSQQQKSPLANESPTISKPRTQSLGSASLTKLAETVNIKKKLFRKHQIRLDTPWLDPNKTLTEQHVNEDDDIILMYRYYYNMNLDRESRNVELLFKQASVTFLSSEVLCTEQEIVCFIALLSQVVRGDHDPKKHTPEFYESIHHSIAPPKCKLKPLFKDIAAQHAAFTGISPADGRCIFVKLWSKLPLFGHEFLSCTNLSTKEKGLIGISKHKIMFLPHRGKKTLSWDFDELLKFSRDKTRDAIEFTFRGKEKVVGDILNLEIPDYSEVVADCINGHISMQSSQQMLSEYKFDEVFENNLQRIILPWATLLDSGKSTQLQELTYNDVFLGNQSENPMFSDEELSNINSGAWENPVFQNIDQLMDERFSFLNTPEFGDVDGTDDVFSSKKASRQQPSHSHQQVQRTVSEPSPSPNMSPAFSRKLLGIGMKVTVEDKRQSSNSLFSKNGTENPFQGSPIIFRKDFLKGSPSSSPRL